MSWMSLAGGGFAVERFDAHAGHQPADPLTADGVAFTSEYVAQHPAAGKWMHHVHLVESAHQRPIGFRLGAAGNTRWHGPRPGSDTAGL